MRFDYVSYEYYLAVAQLVLATFGMGVTLVPRDFWQVLRQPKAIALVLGGQLVLAPCLALLLAAGISLPDGFLPGMILMTAMPVAALTSIFCYLGRGNVPLAISATAITTLGCLATTTIVLRIFGAAYFPADFSMPVARILMEILGCLLLPLGLAMVLGRLVREYARQRISKWCIRGSLVVLSLIVIGSLGSGRLVLLAYGWLPPATLILFAVLTLAACYGLGFLLRMPIAESFTVALLVTLRNGNLGLLLKASLFPAVAGMDNAVGDGVLFVILFYSGTALVIAGIAVLRRRVLERKAFQVARKVPLEAGQAQR